MVDKSKISENMEVVGADGAHIGIVDHVEGDRLKLKKKDPAHGIDRDHHHYVPISAVASTEGGKLWLSATGQDLDIIQSGYTVLETGPRGFTPINTASVTRNGLVELPTGTTVKIGGDRIAIAAPDGRVWIVRPLLAARRQALRRWLGERGIDWIEDPSNDDPAYERVRTRRRLGEDDIATQKASQSARIATAQHHHGDLSWFACRMLKKCRISAPATITSATKSGMTAELA